MRDDKLKQLLKLEVEWRGYIEVGEATRGRSLREIREDKAGERANIASTQRELRDTHSPNVSWNLSRAPSNAQTCPPSIATLHPSSESLLRPQCEIC
jgi:hypothetical protein